MHYSSVFGLAMASLVGAQTDGKAGPVTGVRGNATVVETNPVGELYVATLPEIAFAKASSMNGNIKGAVSATAVSDGIGVHFQISLSNFPSTGGPFLYHIHDQPIPEDGNCTLAKTHLDPFIRGEKPPCDPKLPQTCQVGDLSGKYGMITKDPFQISYVEPFASTQKGLGAFFGNRSIVIHFNNVTRITCASFKMVEAKKAVRANVAAAAKSAAAPTMSPGAPTLLFGLLALLVMPLMI